MAIKRIVNTEFWTDNKVVDMFTPEDKLFMLYLLTNPHASLLGIYSLSPRVVAFEIGYSVEAVKVLLDRFENKYGIILYSEATQEVAVLNWLKHSIIKGGKPVMDALVTDAKRVKAKYLLAKVVNGLKDEEMLIPTVREFINAQLDECSYIDNMDMVMDMELRERNVPRNVNVTCPNRKSKTSRHKYGSYQNVLLSEEELKKLKTEFPSDWEEWIERVSEYVASKGKGYKDYLATIRSWARREKKGGVVSGTHQRTTSALGKSKGTFDDLRNLI